MMHALLALFTMPALATGGPPEDTHVDCLMVDPLLIEQAAEVWRVLATKDNRLWPGWNAEDTPLLFYLPGQQDVLINHPKPPEGFRAYRGPIRFPGAEIWLRDGQTLIEFDGQNTSLDVNQVRTLVVADTLSNRMLNIKAMIEDPRPAAEKLESFTYQRLGSDALSTMGMIAHEAFHVFQHTQAPGKGGDELALMRYPTLNVKNNIGFALEASAIAAALTAPDEQQTRQAALQWLAIRQWRRQELSESDIAYEDGTEFNEGLAKYIEYRLTQVLEERQPADGMWRIQGFRGYADLGWKRAELIDQMQHMLSGEVNVNNDPYGASPVRMRLYYSGMAIASLLDRLGAEWHNQIFQPDTTLTGLATTALGPTAANLTKVAEDACRGDHYETLLREKTDLQRKGRDFVNELLTSIRSGPCTVLVIDYSRLDNAEVGMSFTPFGIVPVGEQQAVFRLIPVSARIGSGNTLRQTRPSPLLRNEKNRQLTFQLDKRVSKEELLSALKLEQMPEGPIGVEHLELPGVELKFDNATLTWQESRIQVDLLKQ